MRSFAMGDRGDTIMSFAKTPFGPAEIGKSQAMEAEEHFRPLPRGITAFRRAAKPIDGEATPESLNSLLGKVSETSMHGMTVSSTSCTRCAASYRTTVIVFNAILRNTRH